MMRRALLRLAPALSAAYGWSLADAMTAPHDVLCWHLGQLPAYVGRAVDQSDIAAAINVASIIRA